MFYKTLGEIIFSKTQNFKHSSNFIIFYCEIVGSGEGNGTPLQYCCLENPMDQGAWWATIHGVAKSRTQLSDFCVL